MHTIPFTINLQKIHISLQIRIPVQKKQQFLKSFKNCCLFIR